MSTGNNQAETIITKKRRRKVAGYIHPNKPEIKKFDFFTGDTAWAGEYRTSTSREFIAVVNPLGPADDQVGAWQLVSMLDPDQGTTSFERVGLKYFLKYMKFKGHIAINPRLPFTIRYKLVLIKSDFTWNLLSDFMKNNYSNYEVLNNIDYAHVEHYCRHNFYKIYKYAPGMANHRTSVTVVSSGTLSPVDYIPKPTRTSTLGSNPSIEWTQPDLPRFGTPLESEEMNQVCYLPLNVSVQVNDNVEFGNTHFYLLLMTDHGVGVLPPLYQSGVQTYYRVSQAANSALARFNFFCTCYFTDL